MSKSTVLYYYSTLEWHLGQKTAQSDISERRVRNVRID